MAELFKDQVSESAISQLALRLRDHNPDFNSTQFMKLVMKELLALELKQRIALITKGLKTYLPQNFQLAGEWLRPLLEQPKQGKALMTQDHNEDLSPWVVIAIGDYIAEQGLEHFELSMTLLKELTKLATAEFAIRPFIQIYPERTLEQLTLWSKDADQHVRRLVSEGSRPRLPWGIRLQAFVEDPSPVLPLLEALKDDSEEYVRRSVANNLNDIAKDHPVLVADIAERWLKDASKDRVRLVKHACRTLLKRGDKKVLKGFGFDVPKLEKSMLTISSKKVCIGDRLNMNLVLKNGLKKPQPIMLDYVVYHQKANGTLSPKVFKWKVLQLNPKDTLKIEKAHSFKPVTTRVYYPGEHRIEILINGEVLAEQKFELTVSEEI